MRIPRCLSSEMEDWLRCLPNADSDKRSHKAPRKRPSLQRPVSNLLCRTRLHLASFKTSRFDLASHTTLVSPCLQNPCSSSIRSNQFLDCFQPVGTGTGPNSISRCQLMHKGSHSRLGAHTSCLV